MANQPAMQTEDGFWACAITNSRSFETNYAREIWRDGGPRKESEDRNTATLRGAEAAVEGVAYSNDVHDCTAAAIALVVGIPCALTMSPEARVSEGLRWSSHSLLIATFVARFVERVY